MDRWNETDYTICLNFLSLLKQCRQIIASFWLLTSVRVRTPLPTLCTGTGYGNSVCPVRYAR